MYLVIRIKYYLIPFIQYIRHRTSIRPHFNSKCKCSHWAVGESLMFAPSRLRNDPFGKLETGPIKRHRLFRSFLKVTGNEFHTFKCGSFLSARFTKDDRFLVRREI
jgi:hypothetical protein